MITPEVDAVEAEGMENEGFTMGFAFRFVTGTWKNCFGTVFLGEHTLRGSKGLQLKRFTVQST